MSSENGRSGVRLTSSRTITQKTKPAEAGFVRELFLRQKMLAPPQLVLPFVAFHVAVAVFPLVQEAEPFSVGATPLPAYAEN